VEGGGKFDHLDLDPTNVVWLVAANSVGVVATWH